MKRNHLLATFCTAVMLTVGLGPMVSAHAADQGRGRGRGQVQSHDRFDDHDRQEANNWYQSHQRALPRGLRDNDRFAPDVEVRIQEGYVLDTRMRRQVYAVPSGLLRLLGPAPRGERYVMINGHILLIDRGYRVIDVIHFGHGR